VRAEGASVVVETIIRKIPELAKRGKARAIVRSEMKHLRTSLVSFDLSPVAILITFFTKRFNRY